MPWLSRMTALNSNMPITASKLGNLGPIKLAFRNAIAKTLIYIEIGLSGDFVRWRAAENDFTSFKRIFYEAALRRPCFQALLPSAEGDEQ